MNSSTQRTVPDIQAGRQRETTYGRQSETKEPVSLPLSPFIGLPLSQPGCLARLSWWTGSFVSLCLRNGARHAGRKTMESKQRETNESVRADGKQSRARHPGWETTTNEGRQKKTSINEAVPGWDKGRQRETNEPVHQERRARHPGWETTWDK